MTFKLCAFRRSAIRLERDAAASDGEVLAVVARVAQHCQTRKVDQCLKPRGQEIEVRTDDGVIGAVHDPRNGDLNRPEEDVEVVLEDDCGRR